MYTFSALRGNLISLGWLAFLGCFLLLSCRDSNSVQAKASVLLLNVSGSSPNDVAAIASILQQMRLRYTIVNENELNQMNQSNIEQYELIVVPGGNYIEMGNALTERITINVRGAVGNGVSYLGICAGGLLAGKPACNCFDLAHGTRFEFYNLVIDSVHKAPVWIDIKGVGRQHHYWEDGPTFVGWGEATATYPDQSPAVTRGSFEKGLVTLCGFHPEAPQSWRKGMEFSTSTATANNYARQLIQEALSATTRIHSN